MGTRFRKSFGKGPFRMTISKSGISTSVGVKGMRVTKTAKGNIQTTASIPKTGLSYTTQKKTANKVESSPLETKTGIKLLAWVCRIVSIPMILLGLLLILVLPSIGIISIIIGVLEFYFSHKYFKIKKASSI